MKITVAYTPGEELAARTVEEFTRALFTDVEVKKSERHPPFKHIYLTTGKPRKRCKSAVNPRKTLDLAPGIWYNSSGKRHEYRPQGLAEKAWEQL